MKAPSADAPDQAVAHISTETIEELADLTRQSASTPEVIAEQVLGYELIITDEGLLVTRTYWVGSLLKRIRSS